jgi:hypothetical protein
MPAPGANADEQLIGYYLLEGHDSQDAANLAATIPAASVGRVEVHPVLQM